MILDILFGGGETIRTCQGNEEQKFFWLRAQELIRERFEEGKIYRNCSILELDVHVTGVHFTTILNNLTDVTYIV